MIDSPATPLVSAVLSRLKFFFLLLLSLITVAKPQNVALTVQTATPETVKTAFKNNTGRFISPEQRWKLEQKTEAGFEEVPFAENFYGWNDIAESRPPTVGGVRTVDAVSCFGHPLPEGEYRFTFYYVCEAAAGLIGGEPQNVSVGFTIAQT